MGQENASNTGNAICQHSQGRTSATAVSTGAGWLLAVLLSWGLGQGTRADQWSGFDLAEGGELSRPPFAYVAL
jgi:hypothetical protein